MATEANFPSFARDIQPLFREKDRASMKRRFDLWNYRDVSTMRKPSSRSSQVGACRVMASGPRSRRLSFAAGLKPGCLHKRRFSHTKEGMIS